MGFSAIDEKAVYAATWSNRRICDRRKGEFINIESLNVNNILLLENILVYAPDIGILLNCAYHLLALKLLGSRNLFPRSKNG